MKALVYTKPFNLEYKEVSNPEMKPDEVLIKVKAVGICGSDVHGYTGSTGRRVPPLIMGHEVAGDIADVGDKVEGLAVGDRVAVEPLIGCEECRYCRTGDRNLCENSRLVGVSTQAGSVDGGMAEFVAVPSSTIHKIPLSVSYEDASQLDAISVAVHAVNRTTILLNDTVAIVGAGTIGLLVLQAVKAAGAGRVFMSDLSDFRLSLARKLGADVTINAYREDPIEVVREMTNGIGADVVLEAVGVGNSFYQAIEMAKKAGHLTAIGNAQKMVEINMQSIVTRELNLRGTFVNGGEFKDCIDLLAAKQIDVQTLITDRKQLSEGAEMFARLHKGNEDMLKVILVPSGEET